MLCMIDFKQEKKAVKMQETCEEKLQRLSALPVAHEARNGPGNSIKIRGFENQKDGENSSAAKIDGSNGQVSQDRRANHDRTQSLMQKGTVSSSVTNSSVKSAARRRFAADSDSDEDSDTSIRAKRTEPLVRTALASQSNVAQKKNSQANSLNLHAAPPNSMAVVPAEMDRSDMMTKAFAEAVYQNMPAPKQQTSARKPYFPHPVFGAPKNPNQQDSDTDKGRRDLADNGASLVRPETVPKSKLAESSTAYLQRGAASTASIGRYASPLRSQSPSYRSTSPAGGRSESSISKAGSRRRSFRIDSDSDSDGEPASMKSEQEKDRRKSAPISTEAGNAQRIAPGKVVPAYRVSPFQAGGISQKASAVEVESSRVESSGSQSRQLSAPDSSLTGSSRVSVRSETVHGSGRREDYSPAHFISASEAPVRLEASSIKPGAASAAPTSTVGPILRVTKGCQDGSAFPTIMDAVTAAQPGQIITIEPGSYSEELCIEKPIQLRATGEGVLIHVSSGHSAVTCRAAGILLSGLILAHSGGDPSRRGRSSARCVEVFSGDVSMIKCEVRSEVGSGVIVADKGSISVQGCVLQGCGKCGVLVFDGGNLLCNDSIVSRNGLYGMVIQNGGTASVEGNRINGNKHAGILVHGKGSVGNIRSNDISSNGEMGVGVQNGAEVRMEKNKVGSNLHAGLFVDGEGSRATVRECEFVDNGVRGVGIQSGAEARILASRVASNSQEGVFVSGRGSRVTVQDSDILKNGTKGLGVQSGAAATSVSNRISGNQEEGVFVSDTGSQCGVRDNSIVENGMKGIGVQSGGQADVDGNLISGNQREGVYISGTDSKALIQNNDVTANGVKGVGVQDGADAALEGNRISGNHYVGVHVYGLGSRALVRENDIHSNSLAAVVTESGGAVQSADNRIDGVKESDLLSESIVAQDGAEDPLAHGPHDGLVSGDGRSGAEIESAPGGGASGSVSQGHRNVVGGGASVAHEVVVEIGRGTDLPQPDDPGAELYLSLSLMDSVAGRGAPVWVDHKGARGARASSRPHGKGTAEDPLVIVPQVLACAPMLACRGAVMPPGVRSPLCPALFPFFPDWSQMECDSAKCTLVEVGAVGSSSDHRAGGAGAGDDAQRPVEGRCWLEPDVRPAAHPPRCRVRCRC